MRRHISPIRIIPRVPSEIHRPAKHADIRRTRHNAVPRPDVILGTDVHVPDVLQQAGAQGRQARDGIIVVRDAVVAAEFLVADVAAQDDPGDAWGAVGVEVYGQGGRLADLGGGDGRDGAA